MGRIKVVKDLLKDAKLFVGFFLRVSREFKDQIIKHYCVERLVGRAELVIESVKQVCALSQELFVLVDSAAYVLYQFSLVGVEVFVHDSFCDIGRRTFF